MPFSFERRKNERHEFYEETKIEYALDIASNETFEADVINVSAEGLSLLITERIEVGQEIILKDGMYIPFQGARVEWIEESGEGQYRIGLIFQK